MLISRRFSGADLGMPGKHNDPRASLVAIKMQGHLGIPAHKIQASGMSQIIDRKIGCRLVPPEPGGCGLRHPARIHRGQPQKIFFMHATPYIFPKNRALIWKLKGHSPQSFLVSCSSARWRKSERLVASNSNASSSEAPHIWRVEGKTSGSASWPEQENVAHVTNGVVGRRSMRLPEWAHMVEIVQRCPSRLHIGKPTQPDESIRVGAIAKVTGDERTIVLLPFNEIFIE